MDHQADGQRVVSTRSAEIVVALLLLAVGAIEMWDSLRLGAGWAAEGPESGYFPFRVGGLLAFAALALLWRAFRDKESGEESFATGHQFAQVAKVLIPALIYVALIWAIGIYVASILFIGAFMRFLGRYRWRTIAAVSIGTMALLFLMFEVWFLVPLPKGPIEELFGY